MSSVQNPKSELPRLLQQSILSLEGLPPYLSKPSSDPYKLTTGTPKVRPIRMDEADRQKRADHMKDTIMFKLDRTGEKDKMKDMLRDKLIHSGMIRRRSIEDTALARF